MKSDMYEMCGKLVSFLCSIYTNDETRTCACHVKSRLISMLSPSCFPRPAFPLSEIVVQNEGSVDHMVFGVVWVEQWLRLSHVWLPATFRGEGFKMTESSFVGRWDKRWHSYSCFQNRGNCSTSTSNGSVQVFELMCCLQGSLLLRQM